MNYKRDCSSCTIYNRLCFHCKKFLIKPSHNYSPEHNLLRRFDSLIQAIVYELGGFACAGIDVDGPGATRYEILKAIKKLKTNRRLK